jgi:hypothetical protein
LVSAIVIIRIALGADAELAAFLTNLRACRNAGRDIAEATLCVLDRAVTSYLTKD